MCNLLISTANVYKSCFTGSLFTAFNYVSYLCAGELEDTSECTSG